MSLAWLSYAIDDEGVAAQKVELIKDGALETLLTSRSPSKAIKDSNGHARRSGPGGVYHGSATNLFIRPRRRYDRKSLLRVDAALSSSSGLALVDPIRSAAIHTRGVLLAMELGEPTRLARALCGEVLYSGMGGAASRRRTERLVHAAQAVAVTGADPLVGWLASACTGIAAVQEGRFDDGVRICTVVKRAPRAPVRRDQQAAVFSGIRLQNRQLLARLGAVRLRVPSLWQRPHERRQSGARTGTRLR